MTMPDLCRLSRRIAAGAAALLFLQMLFGCGYARMVDDEAIDTYETSEPAMPQGTVPVEGGFMFLKEAGPETLSNPVAYSLKTAREGQVKYDWYCIQCHGPAAEGDGTVGQSFVPLPTNLKSEKTQSKSDGEIFKLTMLGYKKMPPLVRTVTSEEAWNIINYIRWLGKESKG